MTFKQKTKALLSLLPISITLFAQPQPPIMGWASWNHFQRYLGLAGRIHA